MTSYMAETLSRRFTGISNATRANGKITAKAMDWSSLLIEYQLHIPRVIDSNR